MKTIRNPKCVCGGGLMPLWKNSNWVYTKCKLEQELPKEKTSSDTWMSYKYQTA